jgi:hypothetical protein
LSAVFVVRLARANALDLHDYCGERLPPELRRVAIADRGRQPGGMSERLGMWAWASGELVDPDGTTWTVTRQRLDLRIVRRALRSANYQVLFGHCADDDLGSVNPEQRAALWEQVRDCYRGPGGNDDGDYIGYEYAAPDGRRLVYIEALC